MARSLSRLTLAPLILIVSLVSISSAHASTSGVITITSAPYVIQTGDEPTISVHAEWSVAPGMSVRIDLKVRNNYGAYSYGANLTSYDADCTAGCQSNLTDGKTDVTFSLTAEAPYLGSIYLYPNSLTLYATLSQCLSNQCTVIASSQPATVAISVIGAPPMP